MDLVHSHIFLKLDMTDKWLKQLKSEPVSEPRLTKKRVIKPGSIYQITGMCEWVARKVEINPRLLWKITPIKLIDDIRTGQASDRTLLEFAYKQIADENLIAVHDLAYPVYEEDRIRCCDCQHFLLDDIGDGTGVGSCSVNAPQTRTLYPNRSRYCQEFRIGRDNDGSKHSGRANIHSGSDTVG